MLDPCESVVIDSIHSLPVIETWLSIQLKHRAPQDPSQVLQMAVQRWAAWHDGCLHSGALSRMVAYFPETWSLRRNLHLRATAESLLDAASGSYGHRGVVAVVACGDVAVTPA